MIIILPTLICKGKKYSVFIFSLKEFYRTGLVLIDYANLLTSFFTISILYFCIFLIREYRLIPSTSDAIV